MKTRDFKYSFSSRSDFVNVAVSTNPFGSLGSTLGAPEKFQIKRFRITVSEYPAS